jgi:hypothetical protein
MNFTLTVDAEGRALLTTPLELSPDEYKRIVEAWDRWKQTPQGLAIIASCDVQHVQSHEIDLELSA